MSFAEKQLIEMEFYAHAIPGLASTRDVKKEDIKITGNGIVSVPFLADLINGAPVDLDALEDQAPPRGPTS